MKSFIILVFLSISIAGFSQITIESIDLPQPGQEYYRSTAINVNIDLTQTGANQLWDYRNLQRDARDTMIYHTVSQTPFAYQFKFNNPIQPNYYSTEAKHTPDVSLGGVLEMTNNYLFSKNSTSSWTEVGIGTTVSGVPFPTQYTDTKTKLALPVNYLDANTDNFSYLMSIPTFGAQGQDGTLSYTVDGWGIIRTPGGSFEALRVKTEYTQTDTIYISLLNMGLRIPSSQITYEWYAKAEGYPVLTVTDQLGQLVSAEFVDDMTVGIDKTTLAQNDYLFPNPTNNTLNLALIETDLQVVILDVSGNKVYTSPQKSPKQIDVSFLSNGIYFVKYWNKSSHSVLQFVKN